MIENIFALARETIPVPAQLRLYVVPCAPEGHNTPNTRIELSIEAGEEYPPDTVWVATIESVPSEEEFAGAATPELALKNLQDRLRGRALNRIEAIQGVVNGS